MHRKLILATIAAAAAACATTPKPTPVSAPASTAAAPAVAPPAAIPAAALADHEGDSPETAVTVPANAPNEGIDFQNNWIYDRYGRFRRAGGGIAHAGEGSATRRYEVVKIELADHSERTVYFDITENEKTWTNTPAPPH
jgi:lipoprotein-anchoring transpeptidase ErfK/SrfK